MKAITTTILFLILAACSHHQQTIPHNTTDQPTETHLNDDLQALAKLYGYVRYFHPTDQAMAVDWDRFLLHAIEQVSAKQQPLDDTLNQLFAPLTQQVHVYPKHAAPNTGSMQPPSDQAQLKYWQHFGLGDDAPAAYASSRVGDIPDQPLSGLSAWISASDVNQHQYRLSAQIKVRVEDPNHGGRLSFSAFSPRRESFAQNVPTETLIQDNQWQTIELTGDIDQEALYLVVGAELVGAGQMWLDDVQLSVSSDGENWRAIEVPNHQFDHNLDDDIDNWQTKDDGLYEFQIIQEQDNSVLQITGADAAVPGAIFAHQSLPYTALTKTLNSDWVVHLPITVWDQPGTQHPADYLQLEQQLAAHDVSASSMAAETIRLANVIKLWNVLQHFYPYFDVVEVNWETALQTAVAEARTEQSEWQHVQTLQQMMGLIQDGHGVVFTHQAVATTGIPLAVRWVEGDLMVTASRIEAIQTGDVIVAIDGVSAETHVAHLQSLVSGSPQLAEFRALNQLGLGEMEQAVHITYQRGDDLLEYPYTRVAKQSGWSNLFYNAVIDAKLPTIEELEPGIFYVNLKSTTKQQFTEHLDQLATARGIIFDQRWDGTRAEAEPMSAISDLLPHLTETVITSGNWQIPQIIWPDQQQVTFGSDDWDVSPKAPYFKGKKVFINVPAVVSSGETFSGMIDHYDLADFVGEPTAGCNGNVNYIKLFNGYQAMYTGMKVEKHDGSQLHLIGYEPDYPVIVTQAGIRSGQDEYLDTALEAIKSQLNQP